MKAAWVTATELGRLMRPHQPLTARSIQRWTAAGHIPASCYEFRGRVAWYSVPRLIAANWIMPAALEVSHEAAG